MAWYNASWNYRVKVTVQSSEVDSTLTNFPVYVDLSDLPADFHTNVKTDGSDIRVTTSDETTEVPREVVSYNSTTDTGELHFKAPSLSSSANTDFYIYYGNSGASEPAVTATYGRNNVWTAYGGVWHMGTTTIVDSTGNASNSTTNTGTNTTGKIGSATDYSGSSQRTIVPHNSAMNISTAGTWSMWVNSDSFATSSRAMEKSDSYFMIPFAGAGDLGPLVKPANDVANMGTLSTGTWYHLAGRFSYSGTGTLDAIKNGVIQATKTGITSSITTTTNDLYIGSDDGSNYFNGRICELRIAQTALSVDWLAAEYSNQNSTSTFYSVGTQETNTINYTIVTQDISLSLTEDNTTVAEEGGGPWYNASWDYRVKITVNAAEVDGTLTDFPVYVNLANLPAGFHTNVKTDGSDIRVTTSDATTEVPREVVSYDATGDTGELHFKAPSLSSTVDTDFYIYYGNAAASEPAATATYGRNNVWTQYEAVYHMEEDPSGTAPQIIDSTGNGYDLTSSGSMTSGDSVTGTLGKAIAFDGSNDEMVSGINHGLLTGSTADNLWISTIVTGYSQSGVDRWISLGSYTGLFTFSSTSFGIQSNGDNSGDNAASQVDTGTHHLFALFDAGTEYRGWMDGSQVFQKTITDTESAAAPITIGDGYGSGAGSNVTATLDEVRISGNNLGANWANAQYSNQSAPLTFYTVGSQEVPSVGDDHTLAAQNTSHSLTTDNVTINQNHVVTIQDISFSLTEDNTTVDPYGNLNYTYEDETTLGTNNTDLASSFTTANKTSVETDNNVYFDLEASNNAVKLFKYTHTNSTDNITITWKGKTTLAPSSSTVYLQIYNHTTPGWETIDSDNTTAADTEFTLTGSKTTNLSDYYSSNVVSARVYQVVV